MKNYFLLLIGAIFLLASCQKDNPVDENELNAAPSLDEVLVKCIQNFNHYQADESTFLMTKKAKIDGVTRKIVFHEASGIMYVVPNQGDCGEFSPPLQMVVEGTGIATHVGRLTVTNLTCVDEAGNFLSPIYGFIIGANGDEIHTMMGTPYPDLDNPPNIYYPYTIIGGTGRFDGATGDVMMHGITDFVNGTWTLSGDGEISY